MALIRRPKQESEDPEKPAGGPEEWQTEVHAPQPPTETASEAMPDDWAPPTPPPAEREAPPDEPATDWVPEGVEPAAPRPPSAPKPEREQPAEAAEPAEDLRSRIAAMEAQIAEAQSQAAELDAQHHEGTPSADQAEAVAQENTRLQERIEELRSRLDAETGTQRDTIGTLEQHLAEVQAELEDQRQVETATAEEAAAVARANAQLQEMVDDLRGRLENETGARRDTVETLEQRLAEVQAELQQQRQVETATAGEAAAVAQANAQLEQSVDALRGRLEAETGTQRETIETLEQRLARVQAELEQQRKVETSTAEEAAAVGQANAQLQRTVDELRGQLEERMAEFEERLKTPSWARPAGGSGTAARIFALTLVFVAIAAAPLVMTRRSTCVTSQRVETHWSVVAPFSRGKQEPGCRSESGGSVLVDSMGL